MFRIYTVQTGDTVDSIASKLGINPDFLRAINGLTANNTLKENDQIIVPYKEDVWYDTYKIKQGDNMYQIAQKFNVSLDDLLLLNGLNKTDYVYPNQEILVPKPEIGIYITKEGDSIEEVGKKLNIPTADMLIKNRTIYLVPDQLILYQKN